MHHGNETARLARDLDDVRIAMRVRQNLLDLIGSTSAKVTLTVGIDVEQPGDGLKQSLPATHSQLLIDLLGAMLTAELPKTLANSLPSLAAREAELKGSVVIAAQALAKGC